MVDLQFNPTAKNLYTQTDFEWLTTKQQSTDFVDLDDVTIEKYENAYQCFQTGDYDACSDIFNDLSKEHPTEIVFICAYILSNLASGNVKSEQILEDRLSEKEQPALYNYLKGMIREMEDNYFQAMEHYSIAMEQGNNFIPAIFRLAYLTDLRGEEEEAIDFYERCNQDDYTYSNALLNLGTLYEDAGKYRKAIECYEKILQQDTDNERAKLFLKDSYAALSMYVDDIKERETSKMAQVLSTPISDFELSVRSRNCLSKMRIKTLGDLIEKSETELLSYKNFGETSLAEIKEILSKKGLKLGMGIEEKPSKKKEKKEKKVVPAPENQDFMDTPISTLELSVRSRKCLTNLNVKTIGDLTNKKESELLTCKNFGITSLQEIKKKLAQLGFSLSPG